MDYYGRAVNFGGSLTVERGKDTYVGCDDDADALRGFASEVAPQVREGAAAAR